MNTEHLPHNEATSFNDAKAYRDLAAGSEPSEIQAESAIIQLSQEIEELWSNGEENDDLEAMGLLRRLRQQGAPAAHILLEELRHDKLAPRNGAIMINVCATSANIPELADYMSSQPKLRPELQNTLARLGDDRVLPYLQTWLTQSESYEANNPRSVFQRSEALGKALFIAVAIQQRAADESSRQRWEAPIQTWLQEYAVVESRHPDPVDLLDDLKTRTHPDVLALAYTEDMFDNSHGGTDPDFGRSSRNRFKEAPKPPVNEAERTETLRNLITLIERPLKSLPNERVERLLTIAAYQERNPSPYAVTLGFEIEVERQSLISPEPNADGLSPEERAERAYQRQANYRRSEQMGVPAGQDAEWEFAPEAAYHYLTPVRETQALIYADLINSAYEHNPLHATLAGITTEGPAGDQAGVLLRGIEATGWCCSAERIEQPTRNPANSWLCKGKRGIKERSAEELQLGASAGAELRTLEIKNLPGFDRTARSLYALGSALSAYQELAAHSERAADRHKQELADIWRDYSEQEEQLFAAYGLASPSTGSWFAGAIRDAEGNIIQERLGVDFLKFADLLRDAESGGSRGQKFQAAAQDNVLYARRRAMAVLDATRPKPCLLYTSDAADD